VDTEESLKGGFARKETSQEQSKEIHLGRNWWRRPLIVWTGNLARKKKGWWRVVGSILSIKKKQGEREDKTIEYPKAAECFPTRINIQFTRRKKFFNSKIRVKGDDAEENDKSE